jgi:hypothetical protein
MGTSCRFYLGKDEILQATWLSCKAYIPCWMLPFLGDDVDS